MVDDLKKFYYYYLALFFLFFTIRLSIQAPLLEYTRENPAASHSLTVCRGQMRSIACPDLQLLHIFNAFYGKLSGHDCQSHVTQLRDQIPTCFSKNAPNVIREACQGQQSCDLYAEDSLYDDPCPSVTKYLFVSFTCQGKSQLGENLKMYENQNTKKSIDQEMIEGYTQQRNDMFEAPTTKSAVVCPAQTGSIYCPALKLLRIKSAFYGKRQGRDCAGKHTTSDNQPTCYARDTMTTIKDMCEGQQSCDLFSEPELYGRTLCPAAIQKYLQVSYMCTGHSDLEQQLASHKQGFQKLAEFFKSPLSGDRSIKHSLSDVQKTPFDLVLRSTLPTSNNDASYYDPWSEWANMNEWKQWKRTNPWMVPQYQQQQRQQQQQQQLYFSTPIQTANHDIPSLNNRIGIVQEVAPEVRQQIPQSYLSSVYNNFQPVTTPQKRCNQCNGDCSNYLCYGCGGCPEPPPEQQMYYYPYQKQDAAYHDAFTGHSMDLSGLIMRPLPKIFRLGKTAKKSGVSTMSKINNDDNDDDSDDDDDDDDSDDDDNYDDSDDDFDDSDDNDNDADDASNVNDDNADKSAKQTKLKKKTSQQKRKQIKKTTSV